jgi:hypothetical protein
MNKLRISMEQNPPRTPNVSSASQDRPHRSWYPKVHQRFHKTQVTGLYSEPDQSSWHNHTLFSLKESPDTRVCRTTGLRDGRQGNRGSILLISIRGFYSLKIVQTGYGFQQGLSGIKRPKCIAGLSHYIVPRLRMHGAPSPFQHIFSWYVAKLSTETIFLFYDT